jgi:hypothetical protein
MLEVVGAVMFAIVGAIGGSWLTPSGSNTLWQNLYPTIGAGIGVIVGFIIVFILIFAWNLFRAPYRQRDETQSELVKEVGSLAYSLQVVTVIQNWPPDIDGIGVIIKLRNKFGNPLRYQVKTIAVTLDNTVLKAPNLVNNGGIIYDETDFILPVLLVGADRKQPHNGIINFIIDYGKPDDRARRRINTSATVNFYGTNSTCYWRMQQESSVNLAFTDEKPSWQPILDTGENPL